MAYLFEKGQTGNATVINAGYNFVLVVLQLAGMNYVFSIETYPQSDSQGTKPVQAIPVSDDDIPTLANPPTRDEAKAYWISNVEKNANGSRKGGIFGYHNLGIGGCEVFIGDRVYFSVVENTEKNTIIQINAIETEGGSLCACNFKAYACQTPSPQAVVDTPNFVAKMVDGLCVMFVFVIARGLFAKTGGKVDYPSTEITQSIAIAGGGFVNGNQTVQQAHDTESEEEGGNAKNATIARTIDLPPRTDGTEEPRYCEFSYTGADGTIKKFGLNRGRCGHVQARFYGLQPELPVMYKATDKTEVMVGFWMPVDEFLSISNYPVNTEGRYVPWVAHQAIVRDATAIFNM